MEQLDYPALLEQVEDTGRTLRGAGISATDRVAVVMPGGAELAACFLGVSSAAACAPLNPGYRTEEFEFYLSDLDVKAVILRRGSDSPARAVAAARHVPVFELVADSGVAGRFRLETGHGSAAQAPQPEPDQIALLLHTSGTTSRPKLVPLTHRNLTISAENISTTLALGAQDRCLNIMPLFHIHGLVGALLSSLSAAASIVLPPGFEAPRFCDWLEQFRPTWYTAVPTMHQAILQRARQAGDVVRQHPLRFLRSSSAALPPQVMAELEEVFGAPVIESYGMTEASHQMSSNPLPPARRKPRSVGLAAGPEVAVMDEHGRVLAPGEVGEVTIRGRSVTSGYANNPDANQTAFHTGGWFRTGDLGYLDEDNYLFLTGRIKEIINRGGEKISPREIDEVLLDHPAVSQAVAFALPDERLGEDVGAAVVLEPGSDATARQIKQFTAGRLADFKVPRQVLILDEIPKGPTGKLQRIGLAERLGLTETNQPSTAASTAPRTPTEEMLCGLWQEVIGIDATAVDEDFFRLGGDSLLATKLMARLQAIAGRSPSLVEFFENPTIRAVARWLEDGPENGASPTITRRPPDSPAVVSSAQGHMWYLHHLGHQPARLNRPEVFELRGPVDVDALRRSLTSVVVRHEVLRTTYQESAEGVIPVINAPDSVDLGVVDLSCFPDAAERWAALVQQEVQRPFDLSQDLVLRPRAARLAEGEFQLFLNTHHIASDGWSSRVLLRELAEYYTAFTRGAEPSLAELPIQYADYASWQKRQLASPAMQRQLTYWRNRLAGGPERLELPTDFPRPSGRSYAAASETSVLPRELGTTLKALREEEGASLFMVLLAAFQVLLHRRTGQDDIVVGAISANRARPELEPLIGLFMNPLPMRADLSGSPTFRGFLRQIRERTLEAFANQEAPFGEIVRAVNPGRSPGFNPLFQILFQLRSLPEAPTVMGPVSVAERPIETGAIEHDLSLETRETPAGIKCLATYRSDLFSPETIRRLLTDYEVILSAAVAHPDKPIFELAVAQPDEQSATLAPPPMVGVVERIEANAHHSPDAIAVVTDSVQLTYRELNEKANRLALRLSRLGAGPDVFVGLHCQRSPEALIGMLAALKAGAAYLPLDPDYPKDRLAQILADSAPPLILTTSELKEELPDHSAGTVLLGGSGEMPSDEQEPETTASPHQAAYIIYTSGSTGKPKGVVVSRSNLNQFVHSFINEMRLQVTDCFLQLASFSFDLSVAEIFAALAVGGTVAIPRPGAQTDSGYLTRFMKHSRVTTLVAVPSLIALLLDDPGFDDIQTLRIVVSCGDVLPTELGARFLDRSSVALYNSYGPTEATVMITHHLVGPCGGAARVFIGKPVPSVEIRILDDRLEPVPEGVAGELCIGGPFLARGYWNSPRLTAERFVPDPLGGAPGARLYCSGDLAQALPDGNIDILGRLDHQVKISGFRVELGEVEWALRQHPAISEVVAASREAPRGERTLAVYYVPSTETPPHAEDLREFVQERLPDYMVPSWFVPLEKIPYTLNGKIDRKALPAPDSPTLPEATESRFDGAAPIQTVSCIFAKVLGHSQIPPTADFFTIGGSSLQAARLVAGIRQAFGVSFSLDEFLRRPTLAAVLEAVAGGKTPDTSPARIPRRGSNDPCPLSFAQKAFWFLERLAPGSRYNVVRPFHWSGPLDERAFAQAVNSLVRRHDILRTTYHEIAGKPVQAAADEWNLEVGYSDLRTERAEADESQLDTWIRRIASEPFDLSQDLPLRVHVLRCGESDHLLLLVIHHIACDGWSLGVLCDELAESYASYAAGVPPKLPPVPLQYTDYAVWQSQTASGEEFAKSLSYWRKQLADRLEQLSLPADRPTPASADPASGTMAVTLPQHVHEAVRKLALSFGVTEFTVFAAALHVLLYRHSGADNIVTGTVVAGRDRPELQRLVGPVVNALPLRLDLSGYPTFGQLLERARTMVFDAMAHGRVPFEKLVEITNPDRKKDVNPLFDVMLEFNAEAWDGLEIEGVEIRPRTAASPQARFPFTLHVREMGTEINLQAIYQRSLFSPQRVKQLLKQFGLILEGAAADPSLPVSRIPLMRSSERDELLHDWCLGTAPEPLSDSRPNVRCAHELIEEQVERTPDAVAVRFADHRVTYRELNDRANRLAYHLRELGVTTETLVAIHLDRRLEMVVAVLAVLKSGGAYVPLDRQLPEARLAAIVGDTKVRFVVTDEHGAAGLPRNIEHVIPLRTESGTEGRTRNPSPAAIPANLAYAIYTAGSTGQPKGVLIEHSALVNYISGVVSTLRLHEVRTFAMLQPLGVDSAVTGLFAPLITGGCLHLISEELALDADGLLKYFEREEIDCLKIAPSHLAALHAVANRPLMPRRKLIVGGEALRRDWARAWREARPDCEIFNHYGPTETTVGVTVVRLGNWIDDLASETVPIGRPLPNARTYILDTNLEPVPPGFAGQLWIGGKSLARAYLNQPAKTSQSFIADPFDSRGGRLYATGDWARYLPDGNLEFLGRRDNQLKIRGYRVEAEEVEAAIAADPAVQDAAVIADKSGVGLAAFVVSTGSEKVSTFRIRARLRGVLPDYMIPQTVQVVPSLPRAAHGKVDRARLRELLSDPSSVVPDPKSLTPPRTPDEEALAKIWRKLLGRDHIGIHDDFFEAGGHSLLVIQLAHRVRQAFQVELSVRQIFESRTIAQTAHAIRQIRAAKNPRAEGIQRAGEQRPTAPEHEIHPASWAQQRLWFLDQLDPGQSTYNMSIAVELRGRIDIDALEKSFDFVARRHEVLRTTFAAPEGEPVQVVHSQPNHSFQVVDLRVADSPDRKAEARTAMLATARQPFDLERGPLLRVTLYRIEDDESLLLVSLHHANFDGWSRGTFYRELGICYSALSKAKEPKLSPVAAQYAEYARGQMAVLQGDALERQLSYWKQKLADPPPPLQLPVDRAPSARTSFDGERIYAELSGHLLHRASQLAREERATLFMVLAAAFQLLLARQSGQTDICIGTPIADRRSSKFEATLGQFLNTLVLRVQLQLGMTFRELLRAARQVAIEAFEHQDVPFERLVDEIVVERDLSRNPLFDAMINVFNESVATLEFEGIESHQFRLPDPPSKFPLTLYVTLRDGVYHLGLHYQRALFDPPRMSRFLDQYQHLLNQATADPDSPIDALSLITPEDDLVLPDPRTPLEEPPQTPVTVLFGDMARLHPQKTAVRQGQHSWSYAQLWERSQALARQLCAHGAGKGSVVALTGSPSFGVIASMLAVLSAGAVVVPVAGDLPEGRKDRLIKESGASLLLRVTADPADAANLEREVPIHPLEATSPLPDSPDSALPLISPDAPAYIFFTSGTSGTPKGVLGNHKGLSHFVNWERDRFNIGPSDRVAQLTNLSFDPVLRDIFVPLVSGAAICLPEESITPDRTLDWLQREEITLLHTVPSMARAWIDCRSDPIDMKSLELVMFAGESLTGDLVDRLRRTARGTFRVVNLYGPTESTMVKCYGMVRSEHGAGPLPVGRPLPQTHLLVVSENGRLCGVGEMGEILIRTPFLTNGYINNPVEQRSRFVANPFRDDPNDVVYRTGDLGRYRPDGSLEVAGRIDAQVKVRGVRVEPEEVSSVLSRHPKVQSCHVGSWEPASGEVELAAYVVPKPPGDVEISDLTAYLNRHLPAAMIPGSYSFLDRLPVTPNGKIDRRALPAPASRSRDEKNLQRAPRNQLERDLTAIWADVLRVENVGPEENFFALGGHSLRAVQLLTRVRSSLGLELPLRKVFEAPTVAAQAEFLAQSSPDGGELEDLLAEIEGLSESQAESMLGEGSQ